MKSYFRSLEVIQSSSYLDDPTVVKPRNMLDFRFLPQNETMESEVLITPNVIRLD